MKFNILFTLQGPGGIAEAPNKNNPVEAADIGSLLKMLADHLPESSLMHVGVIGLKIESDEIAISKPEKTTITFVARVNTYSGELERDGGAGYDVVMNGNHIITLFSDELELGSNDLNPLWEALNLEIKFDYD